MGSRIFFFIIILSQGDCFQNSKNYLYLSSTSFPPLIVSHDRTLPQFQQSSLALLQDPPPFQPQTSQSLQPTTDWNEMASVSAELPRTSQTPKRESLYVVIPMTLIYSLIFLTGLIGNISTCIVISRTRMLHSATNYYLFSLSISDLLLLLSGLPQEMYSIWVRYPYIFGEPFCIIRGLAAEASANATVLTITAFTVERYVAICHPLRSHKLSQLSRVIRIIISIWIVALALALPQAARFGLVDELYEGVVVVEGAWCSIKREFIPYSFEISICVFFVIPMTIITALYILIGMKLRKSRRGPSNVNQEITVEPYRYAPTRHSQTHVIRMLVSVVVAFFVCWAPFHCQRLLAIYAQGTQSRTLVAIYDLITHASGILYFLSTCINPVLYNIMSNKFRQAFKDTLSQLCTRRYHPRGIHHRTYSAASNRSSRMGVIIGNNPHHPLGQSLRHHDTCLNCRHTPSMCSCRGNSGKFVRNYSSPINMDPGVGDTLSVNASPYRNNSPEVRSEASIPLKGLQSYHHSQGPAANCRGIDGRGRAGISKGRVGLRTFFIQRQGHGNNLLEMIQRKRTSDPCYVDVVLLEGKAGRKRAKSYGQGPGGLTHRKLEKTHLDWGQRGHSSCGNSTSSTNSDTSISNSSLQDLDPDEYTGQELATCLAEMKQVLQLS